MPDSTAQSLLTLLLLLQLKHALCDGPLQTRRMVQEKAVYGGRGGIIHAAIHGGASVAVLLAWGMAALPALLLAFAEGLFHYHVDFAKERLVRSNGLTTEMPQFWWALQFDQMVHQFSYVAIAAAALLWP
jgi:hypothetical protein